MRIRIGWLLLLLFAFFIPPAAAVIKVDTPLKVSELSAKYIVVGKVTKFFPDKPAMMVTVTEDLKGKAPFRQLAINCKVERPAKENLIEPLLKRFGPDLDILFFIQPPRGGDTYITFAYTNGTWFHIIGKQIGAADNVVFALISAEPYLRKSFRGTTAELRQTLIDFYAKKAKLPPLDPKVQPGLGPEYDAKQKSSHLFLPSIIAAPGSRFAVIPTIGIGAPLAILALLFPTVFGGVFVLFRHWLAFITLLSFNSTLLILHWWLAPIYLRGTWYSTNAALWFLMTLATLLCTLWAWRRQLNFLSSGEPDAPPKTEKLVLLIMSVSCLLTCALMARFTPISWLDVDWALTVVLTLGILAGTLYRFYSAMTASAVFSAPALATEGIILGAMLLGHLALAPAMWGGNVGTEGNVVVNENASTSAAVKVTPVVKKWHVPFEAPGLFASAPLVHGDVVYAAYSETVPRVATLLCLDRHTGKQKWEFLGKEKDLVQMISTPCFADGKLYFGEGFHDDANCKVYCIDANTGQELWRFKTAGQTESSPSVAAGIVYIGAGNDGLYGLDAKTGAKRWHYHPDDYKGRLLRFGAGICIVGTRLYCGTGVDRNQTGDKGETAVFCFDTDNGKLIWKNPMPYPVWTTPVVRDGKVYVTCGNGDVFTDAEAPTTPGGALVCLHAEDGREQWRFKVDNGIMESPAVDAHRLYFGCRDGFLYCINRADGKERWKQYLQAPIIGTPALDSDPVYGRTVSVFAVASGGMVACLQTQTGEIAWSYNLTEQLPCLTTAPRLVVTPTPEGYRRQLYFGGGLGGGIREFTANRPVFYCLEDTVRIE